MNHVLELMSTHYAGMKFSISFAWWLKEILQNCITYHDDNNAH